MGGVGEEGALGSMTSRIARSGATDSTSAGRGRSSNPVAANRSATSAASTASRTGCSSSITTTRPIGSPMALGDCGGHRLKIG
jgi:hypothetical protein